MPKRILLNWSPPAPPNAPSPAHSILKAWLESHGYEVFVIYWNIHFSALQRCFLFDNLKCFEDSYSSLLYLNYIAIRDGNQRIYAEVKAILKSIVPDYIVSDPSFYDRHMVSAYKQMESKIEALLSTVDFSNTLYAGFSMKMDQWLFASIIAEKIKRIDNTFPVVVGGINSLESAVVYIRRFPQFDYAIWGEGENPLLELTLFLDNTSSAITLHDVSNTIYRNGRSVLFTGKRNTIFLNMNGSPLFPDYRDFFDTRKELHITDPAIVTIEGSRGCHWNRCKFCYLNTDYRYRLKGIDNIVQEIKHVIDVWGIYDFQFLDNDLIGKHLDRFQILMDRIKEVKKQNPSFRIVMAEIITKDLNHKLISKMFEAGIVYAQIGYESLSDFLLRKINKKNTFSSNLLYVKFAVFYKIPLGGVNVITGLPEETAEDIIEATLNLRFLRFFLGYKKLYHVLIPLTVNSSSRYYKEDIKNDTAWHLYKLPHILLQDSFTPDEQWTLFEFIRSNESIQWVSFHKVEKYFLTNRFSYKVECVRNRLIYKEYANNKCIKILSWSLLSVEVEILYITNDKPFSFSNLFSELTSLSTKIGWRRISKSILKRKLTFLYGEGLVYYDMILDKSRNEYYFDNIVSVITLFRS